MGNHFNFFRRGNWLLLSVDYTTTNSLAFEFRAETSSVPMADVTAGTLPASHTAFLDRWLALETSITIANLRGRSTLFHLLQPTVQEASKRAFRAEHLGQMLTLWPGCYDIKRRECIQKATDITYPSNESDENMAPGGKRKTPTYDWLIEIGHTSEAEELSQTSDTMSVSAPSSLSPSSTTSSITSSTLAVTSTATAAAPLLAPAFSRSERSSRRFTGDQLLYRRRRIAEIVRAHATSSCSLSEGNTADSVGVVPTQLPSLKEKDIATTSATGIEQERKTMGNEIAGKNGPKEKRVKFSMADGERESSSPALPATEQLPVEASASSTEPSVALKHTAIDSSSTFSPSDGAADAKEEKKSLRDALKARVAAKEKAAREEAAATGGDAGRRRRRLCEGLTCFTDCLRAYLLQRGIWAVNKTELIRDMVTRLPPGTPGSASVEEVKELLDMLISAVPNWVLMKQTTEMEMNLRRGASGATSASRKALEAVTHIVQFNRSLTYSHVRARVKAASSRVEKQSTKGSHVS